MTQRKIAYELHKPAKIKINRRHVIIKGIDDLYQSDLIEMIPYAKENNQNKYILVVINAYSKYAWAEAIRSKSAKDVAQAMHKILKKIKRPPKHIQTDMGKEFYNKHFKALMVKYNICHYSTYSTMKACIAERFIKTLKSMLYKEFSARGNFKWVQLLRSLIKKYNSTVHRTTNFKPCDVNKNTILSCYNYKQLFMKPKFNVGDFVRISKHRKTFNRGYLPSWTTEVFEIYDVLSTSPPTYLLQDLDKCKIKGAFYKEELQKTKYPDKYLVEKIIRRKGQRVYVKWLGFPNSKNSWINVSDII